MSAKKKTPTRWKVLIVDDHPIMRSGLAQLINEEPDLAVCAEAEDAAAALDAVDKHEPDIAIVDISLKDSSGVGLIKDIRKRRPKIAVLVLSMHDEAFHAERALRAGARGYVTKGEASAKVVQAIRKVLDGQMYLTEPLAAKVLSKLVGGGGDLEGLLVDNLTDREFEVFELLGRGLQPRDIAARLHVSLKTVEAHRENIKKKLKLETAADLLRYAIQWCQFEEPR